MGEHILTLAAELKGEYKIALVCPPTVQGEALLRRGCEAGLDTLPLEVRGDPAASQALCDWLRDEEVDIFHCHAGIGWEGHDGIYAAREAGVRAALRTEHLPYLITDTQQREDYLLLVDAVDAFIAVSEAALVSYKEAGVPLGKLNVVANGIAFVQGKADRAALRAELGLPPHATLVLTVGRMTEQKGHCYLLEAIPDIIEREPGIYFVWVGDGPLAGPLREQSLAMGLQEYVHFLGQRDDVPRLMASCDLFVLPSLFEGLPLSVLEAMAAALPVVGTQVCGTSEAVVDGETGRLVAARDSAALAEAILETVQNPDMAARWGAAGQKLVQRNFSAERMARQTSDIYRQKLEIRNEG